MFLLFFHGFLDLHFKRLKKVGLGYDFKFYKIIEVIPESVVTSMYLVLAVQVVFSQKRKDVNEVK